MKSTLQSKEAICLFFLLISPLLSLQLIAQIQVEPTGALFTPESLVTNVFLGEGVEVTNLTYSGTADAVGYFTNGQNDVGIPRGIVMSSGAATTAATQNNGGGTTGNTAGASSDPYLNVIASSNLNDLARYTISFIPISDTLRFRYSFASEEYPEYACSNFNDVFGFFIHGPGINGAFVNGAENIALIPELTDPSGLTFTDLPVTINNVNAGVVGDFGVIGNCTAPSGSLDYSSYYNDNAGSTTLTYDAYTNVLTAQAVVTPCQEYTIVLAIADVADGAFDSAVFLEAKSFGTGSLDVETATVSLDGTITEGCSDGVLSFTLPSVVEEDLFIDYTIFGVAQNGVDYDFIPNDLFIPAGSNSVSVPVIAFEDGLDEGVESIGIDVQRDPCNRDTFYFFIRDNEIVPPQLQADTMVCSGQSVQLDGTLDIPLPVPPTFENTTDYPIAHIFDNSPPPPGTPPTISPLQVFGVQPPILAEGVIKRVCIDVDHKWISDVDIYLVSPGGQFMELTSDNGAGGDHYTQTCFTPESTDTINFGSFAPKEAAPFTGDWHPEGVWSDLWDGENPTNGFWQLQLKDDAMGWDGTLLGWSICFNPAYEISYRWEPTIGLSCADCPDPIATPAASTTYVLTATDTYGCEVTDSIRIDVIDVLDAPDVVCSTITTNSILFEWNAIGGANGFEVNVNGTGWQAATGALSHLVNNLSLGETVVIEVRGLADCDGTIGTVSCMVPNCTAPMITLNTSNNTSCANATDGNLTVEGSGANTPFEYDLNGITNTTGFFDGLAANDYNIIVTNSLGCASSLLVSIGEPNEIVSQGMLINNASCNGGADGSIQVEVNGGTYPYTFDWNLANSDSVQTALTAGTYFVTITDNSGCSTIDSVSVTEPDLISLSTQVNSISCNGLMDGTAAVVITGGTAPYNFLWDNNANNQIDSVATSLSAGSYFVTVTDNLGCEQSTAALVFENAAIDLSVTGVDPDCNGSATGSATVVAAGGAGSYTYLWDDVNMQTTETADLLPFGPYNVTVTDIDGCSEIININLDQPAPIQISDLTDPITCFGANDGQTVLTVNGGAYPYTYVWSDNAAATDSLRNDLPAGTVQVTVTDANSCNNTIALQINEPAAIALTTDMTPVDCNGASSGIASVSALGGGGNYTYMWDVNGETSATASGLPAGMYTVTVMDVNNCSNTAMVEVTEPNLITLTTQVSAICNGASNGSVMVLPNGGTPPYTYLWDGNANNQVTQEAINLIAGNYVVTVTDAANCSQIISDNIFESPAIDLTISPIDLSCNGQGDGSATVVATGGTAPFNYSWNDANNQTTATASSLIAGNFTVIVSDAGACTQEISVQVNEPDAIIITEQSSTAVSCAGGVDGSAILEVTGGAYPYTYTWSDNVAATDSIRTDLAAGSVMVMISDNNGCSNSIEVNITEPSPIQLFTDNEPVGCNGGVDGSATVMPNGGSGNYTYVWDASANNQTTATATGLPSGTFGVTVSDDQGCSTSITVDVLQATSINVDATTSDVICFGANDGTIELTVDGGNGPYTYQWEGPNSYTSDDDIISNLYAGTYFVTIIDNNNCISLDDYDITQPASNISSTMTASDTICNGFNTGTATVTAVGGTGNLSYLWSYNNVTTTNISDLPAGEHYVSITDAEGCSWIDTALVVERPIISIELSQNGPLCFNGNDGIAKIDAIMEGTNSANLNDYTYSWNNGQSSLDVTQLVGGQMYTVIVTAPNGCTATASITIDNPNEIGSFVNSVSPVNCNNGSDGSADVTGLGGTAPYTYLWNDVAAQSTAIATNLFAGEYLVTITDTNGCSTSVPVSIEMPNAMAVDFNISDVLCPGDANGKIEAIVTGGTFPYTYEWSSGDLSNEVDSIVAGLYSLTITDNNGCILTDSENVVAPPLLQANFQVEDLSCHDSRDARITITPSGGVPPYKYSLDGETYNGSPILIGLYAGDYSIYIQDNNGCVQQEMVNIANPPALEVVVSDRTMELGDSLQLSAEVFNNVGDYTLRWDAPYFGTLQCNPDTITDCEDPFTFTQNSIVYTVYAEDENGCDAEAELRVEVVKPRPIHVPTAFTPNQDNHNDLLLIHGKPGSKVTSFQIYDRWGELVFQSGGGGLEVNDTALGWDGNYRGQAMSTGVYIWRAEVEFIDGRLESYNGNTTLLR